MHDEDDDFVVETQEDFHEKLSGLGAGSDRLGHRDLLVQNLVFDNFLVNDLFRLHLVFRPGRGQEVDSIHKVDRFARPIFNILRDFLPDK